MRLEQRTGSDWECPGCDVNLAMRYGREGGPGVALLKHWLRDGGGDHDGLHLALAVVEEE